MATALFLANSSANSVSADGVIKWINDIASTRPFVKKPEFSVTQVAKILQNKKARDIIYHLVANTRSRQYQIEVIGNLYLQKKLSTQEIAYWRDRLPELQLPELAASADAGQAVGSIEPQAARQLIRKQNALREVEQLEEQVLKLKVELANLAKSASDTTEKFRATSAGNALRQLYLDQIEEKSQEWRKMTSELRRRLVSAGARANKISLTQPGLNPGRERVNLAAAELTKINQKLSESMLDDDIAMLKAKTLNFMPPEVEIMVQKLATDFTVSEIGAALLSNLNRSCADLETELDRVDVSAEIKSLMFDYDPVTGELRDSNPLVTQPASQVMAALALERESALLKVSSEAAEARIDVHSLKQRNEELLVTVKQELTRWLRKDAVVLEKMLRYVEIASAVSGFEQADKALHVCSQAVDSEIRQLESRNRHASLARSKLASFQKNLEDQIALIRRLLEFAASMKKEHESVSKNVGKIVSTLPRSQSPVFGQISSIKQGKLEELEDFRSKNLSALHWGFNASAIKRFESTVGELYANLPASVLKHDLTVHLLYMGPSSLLNSVRDDILLYKCRVALLEKLNAVLNQSKSSKYDEKRVKQVIDQHNAVAAKNWEDWSEELLQASRDCTKAIDEGLPAFRAAIVDFRQQPAQFAADWVKLDGVEYRDYYKNVQFLADSLRQRYEGLNGVSPHHLQKSANFTFQ